MDTYFTKIFSLVSNIQLGNSRNRVLLNSFYSVLLILLVSALNSFSQSVVYSNSGTFTVPAGVTSLRVEAWGGGARGSRGIGGGGGGAFAGSNISVTPGATYAITVGSGGALVEGSPGGNSSFGTLVIAAGSTGLTGGAASSSTGVIKYSGGNGVKGTNNGGGGGGGSAGAGGAGGNGVNTAGNGGGNGGAAGLQGTGTPGAPGGRGGDNGADGFLGLIPGSGGGESGKGGSKSGAGANGQIKISFSTISGLENTDGCVGSTLKIFGTNLSGASSVSIGGVSATITAKNETQISVTVGNGTSGKVSIVTTDGSAISDQVFIVNPLPVVNAGGAIASLCPGGTTTALGGSFGGAATSAIWSDGGAGGSFMNNSGFTPESVTYTASATAGSPVTLTLTTNGGLCGSVSSSKTLVINPNPTVNAGGAVNAVCQGGTTSALGGSFGGGAISAIWSDGGAGGTFTNNSGSTPGTTTYTASATSPASVTLMLTATGNCSTITASKTLVVNENIRITTQPGPATQVVCSGSTINYTVEATGQAPLTYQWYKGATALVDDGNKISGATTSNLQLNLVNTANSTSPGNEYYVKVSSTSVCNQVNSSKINLNVSTEINITLQPAIQTVCDGSNATFTAMAEGTGPFTVQWFKGSNPVASGVSNTNSEGAITTTLTVAGVTVADQVNNYYVIVKNAANVCPTVVSNPATIIVNPNSTISLSSAAGTNAQTLCLNNPITTITYNIGGAGTGAIFSGLPAGLAGTFSEGVASISGIPTVSGSFNYLITTTGNCSQVSASGNIIVSPVSQGGSLSPAMTIGCEGTASGKITLTGSMGSILRWELSSTAGNSWTTIPGTGNVSTFNYSNLGKTTLYRAVIQSGNCGLAYSAVSIIVVDPPYTPSIVATPAITCIGQPVTLTATGYQSLGTLTGGNFDEANPVGWSGSNANNNNQKPNSPWGEAAGPKDFNGVTYNSTSKFMIVNGTTEMANNNSKLSSPTFSTVGLTTFSLTWKQAYNLNSGAVAKVEISIDGGLTYTTLETYTGPADLGPTNGLTAAAINLDSYLGQRSLKVRFNYTGSEGSNWAIDDVNMSQIYWPLNYTWATAAGLSSTSGATVTYTPTAAGDIDLVVYTTTSSNCPGAGSGTIRIKVNPPPTLGGVNIPTVCVGSNLVVGLSGLLKNTTSTLTYQIGNGPVLTVTGVVSDNSGTALFSAPATFSDNGQVLRIISLTSLTSANSVICSLVPTSNNSSVIKIVRDYVWTGDGVGNLWTTAANWNICGVPPDGASVTIPDVSPKHFPKLNIDFFTSDNFDLLGNATIDLNGFTLELGTSTQSIINVHGKIIGSNTSNLTVQGASTCLKFDQTNVGSSNALKNFIINCIGQTVTLCNPLWVVGNVFPTAGVIASNGNLTMVSTETTSSNITAFSLPNDVTGDVNVQSYITGGGAGLVNRGFRSMSSPINDTKITSPGAKKTFRQMQNYIIVTGPGGVANGFDQGGAAQPYAETITLYNETAPAFSNSAPSIASINQAQVPGTGFLAFFRGSQGTSYSNNFSKLNAPFVTPDPVTITYKGPINKFDVPAISLNYTENAGDSYNGYNLVGNPYPSSIDWNKVGRSANVINTFIIVLPGGKQASYLNGVDNNISSTIIQPAQGFYVRASAPGATLTFTENSKSTLYPNRLLTAPQNILMSTNPVAFRGSDKVNSSRRVLRLKLEDGLNSEETTLVFEDGGSMLAGFDDALYFSAGGVSLASFSSDEKRMAINGLPALEEVKEVKLNVNAAKSGSLKLKLTDLSQSNGFEVYLKDSLTGQLIDVKVNPVYSFSIDKAKYETYGNSRLSILFKKEEVYHLDLKPFTVEKQNEQMMLNWEIKASGIAKEFEIEKSADGKTFQTIGRVKSQGNTGVVEKYHFTDKEPLDGMNYYRVRQIHINGRASLSEVRSVNNSLLFGMNSMVLFPNPVVNEIHIKIPDLPLEPVELLIFDMNGRKVSSSKFDDDEEVRYNVASLEPAVYLIEVRSFKTKKIIGREKFVKGF